jgi:hypothetical protein
MIRPFQRSAGSALSERKAPMPSEYEAQRRKKADALRAMGLDPFGRRFPDANKKRSGDSRSPWHIKRGRVTTF